MKNITFVIQGKTHLNSISNVENYLKYGKVVFSCYENDDLELLKTIEELSKINLDVKFVKNKFPPPYENYEQYNRQNSFLQAYSSLNGLKAVETEFAIKIRSDEYFENFSNFISSMLEFPEKFTTINFIFRKDSAYKFHPSDHLFGSKTEILLKCFEILMEKYIFEQNLPAEVKIFVSFLKAKNIFIDINNSKQLTKENSQIVNLRTFEKFIVKNNGANDYKNPLTRTEKDIINIETTDPDSIQKMEDL